MTPGKVLLDYPRIEWNRVGFGISKKEIFKCGDENARGAVSNHDRC
jgi:hypothetical protein